ncbi:MAG: hypothetical protein AB7F43_10000 [Bacteriovoracia bacterium]
MKNRSKNSNLEPIVIWFVMSFFVFGGIAGILLLDGITLYRCTQKLEEGGKSANALVESIKKNKRGNWSLRLSYTRDDNVRISGNRSIPLTWPKQWPEDWEQGIQSKTSFVKVIYSTETPSCWDVSRELDRPVLPKTDREFVSAHNIGFGLFFAILCLLSTLFCSYKLYRTWSKAGK